MGRKGEGGRGEREFIIFHSTFLICHFPEGPREIGDCARGEDLSKLFLYRRSGFESIFR